MSQSDFGTIDPDTKSGSTLATDLNSWRDAVHSGHSGTSRPSYAAAGMTWTNTAANPYVVYFYDGIDDIAIGTVNTTTNVFTPAGISAGTSGGTATAFTYTPTIPSTGNLENQEYDIEFHTAAGTTPTLSVSGQTALAIKYRDSTGTLQAITSSSTPSGWRSRVVNDGTYWIQREIAPGVDITSLTGLTAPTVAANPIRATDLQTQSVTYVGTTGTSTAYVCGPTPAIASYTDGLTLDIQPNLTCGNSPTIDVSGRGAKAIYRELTDGTHVALISGEMAQYHPQRISYYTAGGYFVLRDCKARRTAIIAATRDMTAASGAVAYTGLTFKPSKITAMSCIAGTRIGSTGVGSSAANTIGTYTGSTAGYDSVQSGTLVTQLSSTAGANQSMVLTSLESGGFIGTWTKTNTPAAETAELRFFCEE